MPELTALEVAAIAFFAIIAVGATLVWLYDRLVGEPEEDEEVPAWEIHPPW